MEQTFWLTMEDETDIFIRKWAPDHSEIPRAIVQLSHGMVEHIGRYDAFARFLTSNGFIVYGNDHRGHGLTGEKQGLLGHFADEDGFVKTSDDLSVITEYIQEEHPNVPIFLFGHSMGSFLARHLIQTNSDAYKGVVLSGTGFHTETAARFAKNLAEVLPAKNESKLLNKLVFGSYNRKIPGNKTTFDWLSRDKTAVQAFIDDPLTGAIPTAKFFHDLMTGLEMIHNRSRNQMIRKDLPMLIVSGDADPVGHYETGVWKTAELYTEAGLNDVMTMLFEDARHELLQETNHQDVYEAMLRWFNLVLDS
ncbi:Acylglycerol lipase [Lentibacillus sp. JNUCC-1]|nr:Acylglycerol lipase [Lentibacillus sp. JNUCC-1]